MAEQKKYSVAMIVRNCAKELDRCLASYAKYPDEVVIVNTGVTPDEEGFAETNAVAEHYGAKVFHFPWVDDFAAARNFSFEKCSNDYVMWIDSDDVVENPARCDENIRLAIDGGAEVIFMEYLYEFDRNGNCTTMQKRERVVRKSSFWWPDTAPIHECLCATRNVTPVWMPAQAGRIIHQRKREDFERQRASYRRNLKVFNKHFVQLGKKPELRMMFYWGNTLFGLGDYGNAIEKYKEYLARSQSEGNGNDPEMISAMIAMAEAQMIEGDNDAAEQTIGSAVVMNPSFPTPYIVLAKIAVQRKEWDMAIIYAKQTLDCSKNMEGQLVSNPREIVGRPHWILAMASAAMGRMDAAWSEVQECRKWFSGDPQFRAFELQVEDAINHRKLLSAWNSVRDHLIQEGRKDELADLASFAPKAIAEEMDVNRFTPKKRPAGKKSILFACPTPPGVPPWGPDSIGKGIGGSEEAVINASREFAKRGWHVEVYCHAEKPCSEGPMVDAHGVHWYRFEAFAGEFDNPVDVAVSWRSPSLFRVTGVNAKTKYLWLHDIFQPGAWQSGVENDFDGVILLSKYHRKLHAIVPESKVIYSENGIDESLFVPMDDVQNNPHKLVWGSDPSRGLQYLLPWWGEIRKEVPDAELDIFYGWSPLFLAIMERDQVHQRIHATVEAHKDQPGIRWNGKVGQDVLAKAYASASVWPYMTTFPEIHCITALKIQAHGVIPVTVDDFALSETVQFGEKLAGPMDDTLNQRKFIDRVIDLLKNPWPREKRLEMMRWARSKTWDSVIGAWESRFLADLSRPSATKEVASSLTN